MTTTGSWIARDACDLEDCTMRPYQHRHLADGTPEPAVADPEMQDGVARAMGPAARGDLAAQDRRASGSLAAAYRRGYRDAWPDIAPDPVIVVPDDLAAPASEAATEGEITSVEQLDELAVGTALRDNDGRLYERTRDDCGTWTGAYSRVGRDWPDVPTLPGRLLSNVAATPREQGTSEAAIEGGETVHARDVAEHTEKISGAIGIARYRLAQGDPTEQIDEQLRKAGAHNAAVQLALAATPRAEGEAATDLRPHAETVASVAAELNMFTVSAPMRARLRDNLGPVVRALLAHRCAPPAPEVVSGAAAAVTTAEVGAWDRERFGNRGVVRVALKLAEETGEVAGAVVKRDEGAVRPDEGLVTADDWTRHLLDEVGDVGIALHALCAREGTTLDAVVTRRFRDDVSLRTGQEQVPAGDR